MIFKILVNLYCSYFYSRNLKNEEWKEKLFQMVKEIEEKVRKKKQSKGCGNRQKNEM